MRRYALILLIAVAGATSAKAEPTGARQQELRHLLAHDCGSCHGMTLKGGLGPALTAKALVDKPAPYLELIVLGGRPGTPMPPWRGLLDEDDVQWLVEQLKTGNIIRE